MNKVGVVIVTYNRLALLKEVIESIRKQTFQDFQIVVVNNGSTDRTKDWLESQSDIVTITQKNLGGAGGFHTGLKYVSENGMKFCWLMDDDVVCKPNALQELINSCNVRENIGFVCSRVIGTEGKPMNVPEARIESSIDSYADTFGLVNDYAMVEVVRATFVSVFLSTDIIREVGLPYKEFVIWGDDTEYTLRISRLHPCYIACRSEVVHKRSQQAPLSFFTEKDPRRLQNYFYLIRNHGYIEIQKYMGLGNYRNVVGFYFHAIIQSIKLLVKLDIKRFRIYTRAIVSLMCFKPKIVFPQS